MMKTFLIIFKTIVESRVQRYFKEGQIISIEYVDEHAYYWIQKAVSPLQEKMSSDYSYSLPFGIQYAACAIVNLTDNKIIKNRNGAIEGIEGGKFHEE